VRREEARQVSRQIDRISVHAHGKRASVRVTRTRGATTLVRERVRAENQKRTPCADENLNNDIVSSPSTSAAARSKPRRLERG
jgi:hypothetical protein